MIAWLEHCRCFGDDGRYNGAAVHSIIFLEFLLSMLLFRPDGCENMRGI